MDVFAKLDHATVAARPFPHAIVEDVLDPALADRLVREMPPLTTLTGGAEPGSNRRFNLGHEAALAAPVSDAWRAVLEAGMSQRFLDRVLRLFGPSIRREHPGFEARHGPLGTLRAYPRRKGHAEGGIALEAQIAVNTPVLAPSPAVRGVHVDKPTKLFVGLLYLRADGDAAAGGELELVAPDGALDYDAKRNLVQGTVRTVRTVPYRRNTLVLILNTARSLHAVTPRAPTPHPRYFVNLVGQVPEPIFALQAQPAAPRRTWLDRLRALRPGAG